jgi:hypothetical protein
MDNINQNIYITEFRHTTGSLFDEKKRKLTVLEELQLMAKVRDEVKKDNPHFELSVILVAYKMVSNPQALVNKILDHIRIGKEEFPGLVAGFDMVNEEDYSPGIHEFMPSILGA